ncbi:MAG: hypothetical protein IKV51_03065, partial [Clostridia bacterium]|nr:hypothetical protein [Clostridia bacterium]
VVYLFVLVAVVLWAIWESTVQKSRLKMNLSFIASIGMLGIPLGVGHAPDPGGRQGRRQETAPGRAAR